MYYRIPAILALAALAVTAAAQQTADRTTTDFLKSAIEGNIAEIQMGTLAGQRATEEVVELAQMIVTDHTEALNELTVIAESNDVEIPRSPSSTDQTAYDRLAQQSGISFNGKFVDIMVKNHESTIGNYRSYLQVAEPDPEVADYVRETLPALEKHLEEARSLEGSVPAN